MIFSHKVYNYSLMANWFVGDAEPYGLSVSRAYFSERRGRRSLRGLCAFFERFQAGERSSPPYRVADSFCDFHGQPQGLSLQVVFRYVGDDAHIVPNHMLIHSPAANRFVRDTEPYEFCPT